MTNYRSNRNFKDDVVSDGIFKYTFVYQHFNGESLHPNTIIVVLYVYTWCLTPGRKCDR